MHARCGRPATHAFETFTYCARHAPKRAHRVIPLTFGERVRAGVQRAVAAVNRAVFVLIFFVVLAALIVIAVLLFDPTLIRRLPSEAQTALEQFFRATQDLMEGPR